MAVKLFIMRVETLQNISMKGDTEQMLTFEYQYSKQIKIKYLSNLIKYSWF